MRLLLIPLLFLSGAALAAETTDLRTEFRVNPIGIDETAPRLSWRLLSRTRGDRQTAWQIQVAGSAEKLRSGDTDIWDSGRQAGAETLHHVYGGPPVQSAKRYWWRVRSWDHEGIPGEWSAPAFWEMGLLKPEDRTGVWICRNEETKPQPAPMFRTEFRLRPEIRSARVYIAGVGYHELRLNGRRVGDHMLDPGYTRYDRRVLTVTHDVTDLVRTGENAIGCTLGTGWFNVDTKAPWDFDKAKWRASPRVWMQLRVEYRNGAVENFSTSRAWKTSTGGVTFDGIYAGETWDDRRDQPGWDRPGFDDRTWQPAMETTAPKGILSTQNHVPIRITQRLRAVSRREVKPGVWVFDFGQNFAGVAELKTSGPSGTTVRMVYAEKLNPDGTVDPANIGMHVWAHGKEQRFQTDEVVLAGRPIRRHAQFVYHGFRWVQVTGYPGTPPLDALTGLVLHSDVEPRGEFTCSNELLNRIVTATKWSYRSNLHGIPTDCPHREKNGWTGDAHLASDFGLTFFDPTTVYTKWIQDLADEQMFTGALPGIVPTAGWGYAWGNGPAWDSAFLLIPWAQYQLTGDSRILTKHYEQFKRYVDYLTQNSKEGINGMGLGDWVPWKTETPVNVTSTGYYYRDARIVAETARLLGRTEEADRYNRLADSIQAAFNRTFVQMPQGSVANNGQTALSCALFQGLLADADRPVVLDRLEQAVLKTGGHIDTGILGAKYVLNSLLDGGRVETLYRLMTKREQPGWGWWLEQGATTLWEDWKGADSRNHIMFGDISAVMVKAFAGIRSKSPGYAAIEIKPHIVEDLTHASAVLRTVRGTVRSAWHVTEGSVELEVEIPANCTATVYIPTTSPGSVRESGRPVDRVNGVVPRAASGTWMPVEIGSGSYRFTAEWKPAGR
jgi:alpha-L-rhamnosidase